jgi:hypothetical protein
VITMDMGIPPLCLITVAAERGRCLTTTTEIQFK